MFHKDREISKRRLRVCDRMDSSSMDLNTALQELRLLATAADSNCFNYLQKARDSVLQLSATPSSSMELDSALDKLGMLSSAVRDRLEQKTKKKHSSNSLSSTPLKCVVQMNPTFIKNVSLTKKPSTSGESESEDEVRNTHESGTDLYDRRRRRHRLQYSHSAPYYIRRRRGKMTEAIDIVAPPSPEKASPPTVPRQDSGNKSNPSSPVKSQSSLTNQGSSITRSRSLDDLAIIDCPQDCYCPYNAVRTDIDTVSQSISQLHVS